MEASEITDVLRGLNSSPYHKILIDGDWGIGKTKYILDYIDNASNIYYTSLFGKKSMEDYYQELNYLLENKYKNRFYDTLEKLEEPAVSFPVINVNIPTSLLTDKLKRANSSFKKKGNVILVIDDLERKLDSLDIRELLGFVDIITKQNAIKVVLVANTSELKEDTLEYFKAYAEKSLDREYKITNHSYAAPKDILGADVWNSIKDLNGNSDLKNLRTVEKASLFIKDFMSIVTESGVELSNINTKNDIYKICYSTVLFSTKYAKDLAPNLRKSSEYFSWRHVLAQNLSNSRTEFLIDVILNYYLDNECPIGILTHYSQYINNDEHIEPKYLDYETLISYAEDFDLYMAVFKSYSNLKEIILNLNDLTKTIENVGIPMGYSADDVAYMLLANYDVKVTDVVNYLFGDILDINPTDFVNKVITIMQDKIDKENLDDLLNILITNVTVDNLNEIDFEVIGKLRKFIFKDLKSERRILAANDLLLHMRKNNWLLPLPVGLINYNIWRYCGDIVDIINRTYRTIGEKEDIHYEVRQYLDNISRDTNDKVLKYRIEKLILRLEGKDFDGG